MSAFSDDPRWTAFLLGELSPEETAELENLLAKDPESRAWLEELQETLGLLREALEGTPAPALEPLRREAVLRALKPARRLPAWFPASAAALLAAGLGLAFHLAWRTEAPTLAETPAALADEEPSLYMERVAEVREVMPATDAPQAAGEAVVPSDHNGAWFRSDSGLAKEEIAGGRPAEAKELSEKDAVLQDAGPKGREQAPARRERAFMDDTFQSAASGAPAPSAPPAPASQPVTFGATIDFDGREGLARGVTFDHRVNLNTNGVANAIALGAILRIDTNVVYVGTNAVEVLPAVVPTEPAVTTP